MSCYILYFLDSGWVFSCKIVSFICFGWLLWHLWSFSSVCFYPSFLSFWLSFLMQNPIQTIMPGFCSFHDQFHCRFLTLNTTIVGFDYWDIVFEKNHWITHTDRDSLWDSCFGTPRSLATKLLGSVVSSWKILRFLIKTLKFSQGLRPWTPLTHLVSGFAAHDLRQAKSVFPLPNRCQICFSIRWPPHPGGVSLAAQGNMIQEILRF